MSVGLVNAFYQSREWKAARASAIQRAGSRCSACDKRVKLPEPPTLVDHIKPYLDNPTLALSPTNLRVLCWACHNRRHGKGHHPLGTVGARLDGWPRGAAHPWNRKPANDVHLSQSCASVTRMCMAHRV